MDRLQFAVVAGFVCAVVLTFIRGGWHDAPLVVPVFAIGGFTITWLTAYLIRGEGATSKWLTPLDSRSGRWFRDVAAAIIVVSALWWSGDLIRSGGYGGWLVAILVGVSLPLADCLVASRAAISYGAAAATAVTVSLLVHSTRFRSMDWNEWGLRDVVGWAVIWGACWRCRARFPFRSRFSATSTMKHAPIPSARHLDQAAGERRVLRPTNQSDNAPPASFPDDPYSGRPFGYSVIDKRPVVYSVGPDQRDDGGLVDWNDGAQPGDFILTIGR